jgi:hypothetical protein
MIPEAMPQVKNSSQSEASFAMSSRPGVQREESGGVSSVHNVIGFTYYRRMLTLGNVVGTFLAREGCLRARCPLAFVDSSSRSLMRHPTRKKARSQSDRDCTASSKESPRLPIARPYATRVPQPRNPIYTPNSQQSRYNNYGKHLPDCNPHQQEGQTEAYHLL